MSLVLGALQIGFILGMLAIGIYISFRILNVPDLTAEGSYALGLVTSAVMTVAGHPYLGLVAATLAGMAAGCVTGFLSTKLKIAPILAGIITMSSLYTINLMIMGGNPNISVFDCDTVFRAAYKLLPMLKKEVVKVIVGAVFAIFCSGVVIWFFRTGIGLSIRAVGDNEDMVRASSINADFAKTIGLAIANGLIALCGGVYAQYIGNADVSAGAGMLIIGLASVIIGEVIIVKRSLVWGIISAVLGSIIYRGIITVVTGFHFLPSYSTKLVSAIIVALALAVPAIKERISIMKKGREKNA